MGFILFVVLIATMVGCDTSHSREEIVIGYRTALNSHSVDSLMKYYGDEIVFRIPDLGTFLTGVAAMRGVAAYDSALNTQMKIVNIRVQNDTVTCSIIETNNWMDAAGISSAYYPRSIFVVKDGKIIFIEADLADSCAKNFQEVLDSFVPWAQEDHAEELALMTPGGEFRFNAENGKTMVRLLREWRTAEK